MKLVIPIIGLIYYTEIVYGQHINKRVLCYYDSESSLRKGYARFTEDYLKKALPYCTHLMYGYGGLYSKTFSLSDIKLSLNLTSLKESFPKLKIYLSLGGDKDIDKVDPMKYVHILEAGSVKQKSFRDSSKKFLKTHHFDGLDLAFQFPRNKPPTDHSGIAVAWSKFEKVFSSDSTADVNAETHKHQYTKFVYNLKKSLNKENLSLAMTVLPNVNSTWYFDIKNIQNNFEFINLFAFDFLTPQRNPEVADYTAPLFPIYGANRLPYNNVDYQVNYWIRNGCPANKINLGIATYGRAWKLTTDSGLSGMPPIENTNGPADQGNQTRIAGLLSYPEICSKLSTKTNIRKFTDKTQKYGNYAFYANKSGGIWISYDDPEFAAIKAEYVYCKGMGGIALYDLSYDDFRGHCMGAEFSILQSVSKKLEYLKKCPRKSYRPAAIKSLWQHRNYD